MPPVANDADLHDLYNGGLSVEDMGQTVTRPSAAVRPQVPQTYPPTAGNEQDLPDEYVLNADPIELFEFLQTFDTEMQLG
jgi:hypothetical protein